MDISERRGTARRRVEVVVELPLGKILCEVKYRNQSRLFAADAIMELCRERQARVSNAFLMTKQLTDYGLAAHETSVPILRVPALVFLYLLGKAEAEGRSVKL